MITQMFIGCSCCAVCTNYSFRFQQQFCLLYLQSGEIASVSENASKHDDAVSEDASTILKHGNPSEEIPPENNGEYAEAESTWKESNQDVSDGEQDGGTATDDIHLDHEDATFSSKESCPVNGESLADIENEADTHEVSQSANELESNAGILSHGDDVELSAADNVEGERADGDEDVAAVDAETERTGEEGQTDVQDAEHLEPSSELDAGLGTDDVDAPSPMDVDVAQPTDAGKTSPDAGCDSAMEVESPTGDITGGLASSQLATESAADNEKDQESPMAEDVETDDRPTDQRTSEQVDEVQDSQKIDSENTDSENIVSESAAADAAEYDEVDASQSKTSHQSEVPDNSEDADESGNADGLVEGDDFTVELQPDTSEQESAASEVDQTVPDSETTEKTGVDSEPVDVEESDKTSSDVKTTIADDSTAPPPVSSDTVCIYSIEI